MVDIFVGQSERTCWSFPTLQALILRFAIWVKFVVFMYIYAFLCLDPHGSQKTLCPIKHLYGFTTVLTHFKQV